MNANGVPPMLSRALLVLLALKLFGTRLAVRSSSSLPLS
jgi:hypothetical protein